jgi:CRP/FNR family transcriptional regulator
MNNLHDLDLIGLRKKVKCETCVLSNICITATLTDKEIKSLDTAPKSKSHLEKDDVLYHAGESKHKIYAVSSGSLKTTTITKNGVEQITGFYLPGEILGLEGLADMELTSTATAIESSTVCEIPEQDFDKLCQTNSGLRKSFMRVVSKEISNEQRMMVSLGQMKSDEKLASFLISLSSRFKQRGFSEKEFNLSMPRHDIANYLGLTIETISRLFKSFQKQGLLEVNNRQIKLSDRDALCDMGHTSCHKK